MKLHPKAGGVAILFAPEEVGVLRQLVSQLLMLIESHSSTPVDPDPLFASLEVGGTEIEPADPALARLFPDAYEDKTDAADFRRVTEQGLINRKMQDARRVMADLEADDSNDYIEYFEDEAEAPREPVSVCINPDSFLAWAKTITALRLAMAARIGLDTEADYDRLIDQESTRGTVLVYDWLAALLEAVLAISASNIEEASAG